MNNEKDKKVYGNDEIKNLWTAVCNNDIEFMKDYYEKGGMPNKRYNKNSLIIGALKNKNYDMVELLKQKGELLLGSEIDEYKKLMVSYDYNDELTNIYKVEDLLEQAQEFRENNTVFLPKIESSVPPEGQEEHRKLLLKTVGECFGKLYK